jgi:site-specific DNA-methyltransferase (adenine-specific)
VLNSIIHGDCLEVMPTLPKVDLVVTSPPYNLGKGHHTGNIRHNPYNDNLPEDEYQKQQIEVLNALYACLKQDGSLFYNHKNRIKGGQQITPYEWILKTDFIIKQELVWFNGSQNFDKIRFYPMTERIYWLAKSPKTKLYNTINHHDVFDTKDWPPVGTGGSHTRAFPVEMVEDILSCFPNARTVLDPYIGSGTTAIACINMGRSYIGIEKDKTYYDIACKRIAEHGQQLTLFAGPGGGCD